MSERIRVYVKEVTGEVLKEGVYSFHGFLNENNEAWYASSKRIADYVGVEVEGESYHRGDKKCLKQLGKPGEGPPPPYEGKTEQSLGTQKTESPKTTEKYKAVNPLPKKYYLELTCIEHGIAVTQSIKDKEERYEASLNAAKGYRVWAKGAVEEDEKGTEEGKKQIAETFDAKEEKTKDEKFRASTNPPIPPEDDEMEVSISVAIKRLKWTDKKAKDMGEKFDSRGDFLKFLENKIEKGE